MPSTKLHLSPPLTLVEDEAHAMGLSLTALLTADIVRYRRMAESAVPKLDQWQWGLLGHVLDGIEAHHILTGDDSLPSAGRIVAEIDTWADSALDDDTMRAHKLRGMVASWSPLAIAGVLLRLRAEAARTVEPRGDD